MPMFYWLLAAAAALTSTAPWAAVTAAEQTVAQSDETEARAVVEQFCKLEAAGAVLDSQSPTTLALWKLTVGDEDGADENRTIVSGFRIDTVRKDKDKIHVRVVYQVVGTMDGNFVVHVRDDQVPHTYELKRTSEGWKIAVSTIDFMFHVSAGALLHHMEDVAEPSCRKALKECPDLADWCGRIHSGVEQLRALVRRLGAPTHLNGRASHDF